jgi:hypothetical protein
MRRGFGEPLLPVVIAMLGDLSIRSDWIHYFASVIVAFAANGINEATVTLLRAVLTKIQCASCHMRMCVIVAISARVIVDPERTLAIVSALEFTPQAAVDEVDGLFDIIPDFNVEQHFIVAGLFQLPDTTFQIDETTWTTTEFALAHLVRYAMQEEFETWGSTRPSAC